VWLVHSDGTGERQLTFDDAEIPAVKQKFIVDRIGSWSPNSRWLAYSRQVDSPYNHTPTNANAWNVLVADVGTGQITTVSENGRDPAWSPDGTKIAYAAGGIAVVNADGSDRLLLTDHAYTDSHPVWSPDGKSIAFTGTAGYGTELFLIRAEGGDLHNLTGPCTVSPALPFGYICTNQGSASVPVSTNGGDYSVHVFGRSGLNQVRTDPCHCFTLSVVIRDAVGNRVRGVHVRATAGAVRQRYGPPRTTTYGTAQLYLTTTTALRKTNVHFFAVRIEARDSRGKVRGIKTVRLPLPQR
jgi:dipeptidyl aminopeptidase/acylaminoacyl peptidase